MFRGSICTIYPDELNYNSFSFLDTFFSNFLNVSEGPPFARVTFDVSQGSLNFFDVLNKMDVKKSQMVPVLSPLGVWGNMEENTWRFEDGLLFWAFAKILKKID